MKCWVIFVPSDLISAVEELIKSGDCADVVACDNGEVNFYFSREEDAKVISWHLREAHNRFIPVQSVELDSPINTK